MVADDKVFQPGIRLQPSRQDRLMVSERDVESGTRRRVLVQEF